MAESSSFSRATIQWTPSQWLRAPITAARTLAPQAPPNLHSNTQGGSAEHYLYFRHDMLARTTHSVSAMSESIVVMWAPGLIGKEITLDP